MEVVCYSGRNVDYGAACYGVVRTANLNRAAARDYKIDLVLTVWFLRYAGANLIPIESQAQRGNPKELPLDLE